VEILLYKTIFICILLAIGFGSAAAGCLAHDEDKRLGHFLAVLSLILSFVVAISGITLSILHILS